MKIDNSVKTTGAAVGTEGGRSRAGSAALGATDEVPSTKVNISSMSALDGAVASAPVTNPDRVAEIKQAIAEGRFTVNPDKIAGGLLDSVRQMLGKTGASS